MTTILILVDAFSYFYLNSTLTPLCYEIGKEGIISSLRPLFAFQGIEHTIFTGKWPSEHGVFTEMYFEESNNIADRLGEVFLKFVDILGNDKISKLSRILVEVSKGGRRRLTPNVIPPEGLKYFSISARKPIYERGAANTKTLFDVLRENDLHFIFEQPAIIGGDEKTVKKLSNLANKLDNVDFVYVKLSGFDRVGHIYGPSPIKFKDTIRKTEQYIEDIINIFGGLDKNNILIITDHGMSLVYNYIDILSDLKKISGLSLYDDYIVFLDSTLARFWFKNEYAKKKITEYLSTLEYGHILTEKEIETLHLPTDIRQIGDVMFIINEGSVIYPDFWSGTRKPKGMHGYAYANTKEALAVFIANSNMAKYYKKTPTEFVDILDGIIHSLVY